MQYVGGAVHAEVCCMYLGISLCSGAAGFEGCYTLPVPIVVVGTPSTS